MELGAGTIQTGREFVGTHAPRSAHHYLIAGAHLACPPTLRWLGSPAADSGSGGVEFYLYSRRIDLELGGDQE